MDGLLAMNGFAVGVLCAAVVVVTVILWTATRPPVFASARLPPVLRRGVYWWLGATCLFALLGLAWVVLRRPLGLPRHGGYRYVPLALGLMPLLVVNPLYLWRTAWVRRSLTAAGGRLCTHCAYDVSGLGPVGTCPECGRPYDAEADAGLWANAGRRPGDVAGDEKSVAVGSNQEAGATGSEQRSSNAAPRAAGSSAATRDG